MGAEGKANITQKTLNIRIYFHENKYEFKLINYSNNDFYTEQNKTFLLFVFHTE